MKHDEKKPAPRSPAVPSPNANKPARVVGFIDVYPERINRVLELRINEVGPSRRGWLRAG